MQMPRMNLRMFAHGRLALVASATLALGAGCASEPAGPTYVEGTTVTSATSGPAPDDPEVVYVQDAPVVDIEAYPSVVYEGAPVYYVGGQWYRQGPRGWGYFRQEPAELGRQRSEHERDPRWVQAREAPRRPEPAARPAQVAPPVQAGRPEPFARPEQPPRPELGGRPEQVAPPGRAEPVAPARPGAAEPRAEERREVPGEEKKPAAAEPQEKKDEAQPPPAGKPRRPPVKRGPAPPAPERR